MKRFFLIVFAGVLFVGLYVYRISLRDAYVEWRKPSLPEPKRVTEIQTQQSKALESEVSVNLDVPFSPQAPHANWALPYQEACEEASVLLVHKFFKNEPLTPEIADREILKIVEWEKKHFGFYEHTSAEQTAEILRNFFGYQKVEAKYDISIDDIKKELREGRPIIVPFAGRKLGNPYYRQPGPVYHMLVIKGFTQDGKFITNDVGTKRGKDFLYHPNILWNAIHDAPEGGSTWNHPKPEEYILSGRKAMIVVYSNDDTSDITTRRQ